MLNFNESLECQYQTPMTIQRSIAPPSPKVPVDPGKLFIWQEPYKPIVKINPNTPGARNKAGKGKISRLQDARSRKEALFLGFNRLGDFLCTTPAIHAYRMLHPDARITYIVQNAEYCRALDGNPDIDFIIYSEDLQYYGEKVLSEEWVWGLPIEITEPTYLYRFNVHEVCRTDPQIFNDHISRGFARVLDIPIDSVRPIVTISSRELAAARRLVRKPYIIFSMHTGSKVIGPCEDLVLKDWIFEQWLHLAKRLTALGDLDIIAIGSQTDRQVQTRHFRNLYGLPIKIVAALLKQAACVVTTESGVSHLCHAVDAPMVVIFSKYVAFPWAFPREAGCCRVICDDPRLISAEQVLEEVKSILTQKGSGA